MRLIIWRSSTGYRWTLRGKNGRIIAASSEAFASRRNARLNAERTYAGLREALGA